MKKFKLSSVLVLLMAAAICSCTQAPQEKSSTPKVKFSFAYLTDVHLNSTNRGNSDEGLRAALADAKSKQVALLLFGGDNTDSDGLGDAQQTADSLQARFKSIVDESGLPAYFTIGNHDRFYRNNSQTDTLGFKLFEKQFGKTYHSFNHQGVHFIVLNSLYPAAEGPYSIDPAQLDWLKHDLQQTGKETPVVVSLHVPMLSLYYPVVEGNFKGADMIVNTKQVFETLNDYNVKLILQGHQHIYEQIQERNRWFVTAGAVSAYWWAGNFLETEEGYLLVHVDEDNNFSWEYVDYGWNATQSKLTE